MSIETIDHNGIVIVGAGIAGGEVATALRQEGFEGRVVIVGDEIYLPYHRPPLSKTYLAGSVSLESLNFKSQETYNDKNISIIPGVRVTGIERSSKIVNLSDGRRITYGKLVLAIGGRPRMLDAWKDNKGNFPCNLYVVRTIEDVHRLRPRVNAGARLAIIGGGFVGLEVAAVAVQLGLHVTVLEALPRVLARVTSPMISAFYEGVHREAGVEVRTGTKIRNFDLRDNGSGICGIVVEDGTTIPTDFVVAGIGMVPNVELAQIAGLEVKNGILVDENTQTSDPDIFAIGDCTNHPDFCTGERVRLESVPNALAQARTAAATICGKHKPHRSVPWFWSDQYNIKLQIAGLQYGYDDFVLRGSTTDRKFAVFYLKGHRILAVDSVNRPHEFGIAKALVAQRVQAEASQIADETIPLATFLEN